MSSDPFSETLRSLERDPDRSGHFLLVNPHLLYLTNEQSKSYIKAMHNHIYHEPFHQPTLDLIRSNLATIFSTAKRGVALIDLGPGYPDKSLPVVKYLQSQGTPCRYIPVVVNQEFLNIARAEIKPFVEHVYPIRARFESCALLIPHQVYQYTTFCMIGLTFMNFLPGVILPLLQRIAGHHGFVIVATELLNERKTREVILRSYRNEEIQQVGFGPLKNLGLRPNEVSYEPVFADGRVELRYMLKREPSHALGALGMRSGDTIITAVSYRYTEQRLNHLLREHFAWYRVYKSADGGTAIAVAQHQPFRFHSANTALGRMKSPACTRANQPEFAS